MVTERMTERMTENCSYTIVYIKHNINLHYGSEILE